MTAPDTRWVTRTIGAQPPHIEAVADAIVTATTSRSQSLQVAWLLHDAGLLARPGEVCGDTDGRDSDGDPLDCTLPPHPADVMHEHHQWMGSWRSGTRAEVDGEDVSPVFGDGPAVDQEAALRPASVHGDGRNPGSGPSGRDTEAQRGARRRAQGLDPARKFQHGDPEPDDLRHVRDREGDLWTRRDDGLWETPETDLCEWWHITKKWAPLVEIFPPVEAGLVRIETDERPLICGCGNAPSGAPGASGCSPQCMEPEPEDAVRAPRVWKVDDPEPDDRPDVRDSDGDLWTYNADRGWLLALHDRLRLDDEKGVHWRALTTVGPLTEVIEP